MIVSPDNFLEPPPPLPDKGPDSLVSISHIAGPIVNAWSAAPATGMDGDTMNQLKLQLRPEQGVVIGRQEGGRISYLDPRWRPTQLIPDSGRRVVQSNASEGPDNWVSRGHFLLKSSHLGIVFVNGVPRDGGGIRPPTNGTEMLAPESRRMEQGEEFLIDRGAEITIRLPNRTVLQLRAE
jgi:hypothetical protein